MNRDSLEDKERKFTKNVEKVIMNFIYLVFVGIFGLIAWTGTLREAW